MDTYADKTQEDRSQSVANAFSRKQSSGEFTFQFVDNRPEAIAQRKLQEMANNNSPQVKQLKAFSEIADDSQQATQFRSMTDTCIGVGEGRNSSEIITQLHPVNVVQFVSSYTTDISKSYQEIYMIYERKTPQELVQYIGRTNQGLATRLGQHRASKPWVAAQNCDIQRLAGGNWTKFEVATHEQYWINDAGGKAILENSINGIDYDKYHLYRTPTGSQWNANQEIDLWSW